MCTESWILPPLAGPLGCVQSPLSYMMLQAHLIYNFTSMGVFMDKFLVVPEAGHRIFAPVCQVSPGSFKPFDRGKLTLGSTNHPNLSLLSLRGSRGSPGWPQAASHFLSFCSWHTRCFHQRLGSNRIPISKREPDIKLDKLQFTSLLRLPVGQRLCVRCSTSLSFCLPCR